MAAVRPASRGLAAAANIAKGRVVQRMPGWAWSTREFRSTQSKRFAALHLGQIALVARQMNGARWKVGERVRLRRAAALYVTLGAGSFVVVELGEKVVIGRRREKRWELLKRDLVRMGRGL